MAEASHKALARPTPTSHLARVQRREINRLSGARAPPTPPRCAPATSARPLPLRFGLFTPGNVSTLAHGRFGRFASGLHAAGCGGATSNASRRLLPCRSGVGAQAGRRRFRRQAARRRAHRPYARPLRRPDVRAMLMPLGHSWSRLTRPSCSSTPATSITSQTARFRHTAQTPPHCWRNARSRFSAPSNSSSPPAGA